jgi:hypothetical protein
MYANYDLYVWSVFSDGYFGDIGYSSSYEVGVRPVIIISKDYFN